MANIVGEFERSEDLYPPDWPCHCGHRKDEHYIQEFDGACSVPDEKSELGFVDDCMDFVPIDNLTYVEKVANDKQLS